MSKKKTKISFTPIPNSTLSNFKNDINNVWDAINTKLNFGS